MAQSAATSSDALSSTTCRRMPMRSSIWPPACRPLNSPVSSASHIRVSSWRASAATLIRIAMISRAKPLLSTPSSGAKSSANSFASGLSYLILVLGSSPIATIKGRLSLFFTVMTGPQCPLTPPKNASAAVILKNSTSSGPSAPASVPQTTTLLHLSWPTTPLWTSTCTIIAPRPTQPSTTSHVTTSPATPPTSTKSQRHCSSVAISRAAEATVCPAPGASRTSNSRPSWPEPRCSARPPPSDAAAGPRAWAGGAPRAPPAATTTSAPPVSAIAPLSAACKGSPVTAWSSEGVMEARET
mmetsp:Transcript_87180/g.241754  ORF Transcript_87180/g.241754 Transcript_87180/m.241754 type:complete len:299 (+) Transcript_87180:182-1078(+)